MKPVRFVRSFSSRTLIGPALTRPSSNILSGATAYETLRYRYTTTTFSDAIEVGPGKDGTVAACFRYIVNDVSAAIDFYTKHLGFRVEMHPTPGFAEISLGDMHLYLSEPQGHGGGGAPMPSGEQQRPGGWNRIHLLVDDLDTSVARLGAAGVRFRNAIVQGTGGK